MFLINIIQIRELIYSYIIQRKKTEAVKSIEDDGSFWTKTKAAVIVYQKSRGLSADGYVGYDTHTAIIND